MLLHHDAPSQVQAKARALAERLHYRLVERGELVRLAERIGGPDVAWERSPELRERSPSFWERLNEERRRDLVKVVHNVAEECRVAVRNIRRDVMHDLRELKKGSEIG